MWDYWCCVGIKVFLDFMTHRARFTQIVKALVERGSSIAALRKPMLPFWLLSGTMLLLYTDLKNLLHVGSICFKSQSPNQQITMYLKTWQGLGGSPSFLKSL